MIDNNRITIKIIMKKILLLLSICFTISLLLQIRYSENEVSNFFDYIELYKTQNGDSIPSKQIQRLAKIWGPRLAPSGDASMAGAAYYEYAQNYENYQSTTYEPNWEEIGPIGTNTEATLGQIHNIIFDPGYGISNQTIYACSSFGGLWRSENDGFDWMNVNTDIGIPVSTVSDLAIHPQNSDTLFITTGRADGGLPLRYRTRGLNPVFSTGVFRSTDYGATWHTINGGLSFMEDGYTIREIEINPDNPDQLFIATDDGVYRTNNANATNPSWVRILSGLNGNEDTEFKGLEFKPGNSNTIYASGLDIYKSIDGGTNWISMTEGTILDLDNMLPPLDPPGPDNEESYIVDRINITTSPAAPERLYAYIEGTEAYWSIDSNQNPVVKSVDRYFIYMYDGSTWNYLYKAQNSGDNYSRIAIAVSPANANSVYYGTIKLKGCNDITVPNPYFSNMGGGTGLNGGMHDDVHALEF